MHEGLVIQVDRKKCLVEVDGELLSCTLRGRLFTVEGPETRPVAVGDRVAVELGVEDTGTIEQLLPRRNAVYRGAPRQPGKLQTMAANVDALVIVASVKRPTFRAGMVDRLLVAAECAGIGSQLVLNKVDLASEAEIAACAQPYRDLDYQVLETSAKEGLGIEGLKAALTGRRSLVIGHSGVGKSSLLNCLDSSLKLKIGEISSRLERGRHTTTRTTLLRLGFGAELVDSPGVREFSLAGIEEHELGGFFRDLAPYHKRCRYPTCTHTHEPDCAVKAAEEAGELSVERVRTYRKLLEELSGGGERMPRHSSF